MPISTKERTNLREELVSQGYSWKYIDEWQPKTTLYRHRALRNPSGEVVSDVGASIKGVPGQPDYVNRKARQGLLQWPPSDTCTCKWCLEGRQPDEPVQQASQDASDTVEVDVAGESASTASVSRRRESGQTGPYYQAS
jgi:hypothetical protein